jgi:hypothetical protein
MVMAIVEDTTVTWNYQSMEYNNIHVLVYRALKEVRKMKIVCTEERSCDLGDPNSCQPYNSL